MCKYTSKTIYIKQMYITRSYDHITPLQIPERTHALTIWVLSRSDFSEVLLHDPQQQVVYSQLWRLQDGYRPLVRRVSLPIRKLR